MEQPNPDQSREFAKMLRYAADSIDLYDYFQRVVSCHECNTCGGSVEPYCPYLPKAGELVRINCPLWYEKKG